MAYESAWVKLGRDLLEGKKIQEITLKGKLYKFNPIQSEFISDLTGDFCLNAGGYGSGKSLALYIKLILFCKCFPQNRILLGRKTLSDIDRAVLPELFELLPPTWYEHRVKDCLINFNNGSQIVLFGLDAMQSGGVVHHNKKKKPKKSRIFFFGGVFLREGGEGGKTGFKKTPPKIKDFCFFLGFFYCLP